MNYNGRIMKQDNAIILKALEFATEKHAGQWRHDKLTPYIIHPLEVFKKLIVYGIVDIPLLIAAILHDVIEDCGVTKEEIERIFGKEAAQYVVEVSKVGVDQETIQVKMEFLKGCADKSIHALILKIADRACNVRDYQTDAKRPWYAAYYAMQAYPLIKHFYDREQQIKDLFGEKVFENVLVDILDLGHMVHKQYGVTMFASVNTKLLDELIFSRNKGVHA